MLSLTEIKNLIKEKNIEPRLNSESMMKELVWDDQWMGYDDEKTHEMKRKFANDLCFGGTMAWSVDLNSGTGDTDDAPLSTDGRCGPDNGGAMCDGSGFGKCCSSGGWCGSSDTHCGSGCLNGKCHEGIETTDGTCGTGHGIRTAVCGPRAAVVPQVVGVGALALTAGRAVKVERVLKTRVADLARFISILRSSMPLKE